MANDPVTGVTTMIREGITLLREWIAGANVRHLKAAVEAGEKYIRKSMPILEKAGLDAKEMKELKELEERFFKYN